MQLHIFSLSQKWLIKSAAAHENSWVAQWTTQLGRWVVRNNFRLSDIKYWNKNVYFDNHKIGYGPWQEKFAGRQSDM